MEVRAGEPVWAVGVMTGTSMDAVDVALIRTDGEEIIEVVDGLSWPIGSRTQALLADAMARAGGVRTEILRDRARWPNWLRLAEFAVGHDIRCTLDQMLISHRQGLMASAENVERVAIDRDQGQICTGVHGQTIVHRPDEGFTLQIGQRRRRSPAPNVETGGGGLGDPSCFDSYVPGAVEVVDFRSADLKAGGQGAPLAPFYHFSLAKHVGATEPIAFLNIGGVANVTWVDPSKSRPEEPGALLAFDTGPGNALINDWIYRCTGVLTMDLDGGAASTGRVHRDRLRSNSAEAYLRRRPPKSLDRNDFAPVLRAMQGLSINDGAATLTAFTADCVAAAMAHLPAPPSRWLVCGGGRLNATMMAMLAARLGVPVEPVEAVGLDGDMLEAQAFAFLAVRVLRGLPTSAPGTTGCREPVCGGTISYRS